MVTEYCHSVCAKCRRTTFGRPPVARVRTDHMYKWFSLPSVTAFQARPRSPADVGTRRAGKRVWVVYFGSCQRPCMQYTPCLGRVKENFAFFLLIFPGGSGRVSHGIRYNGLYRPFQLWLERLKSVQFGTNGTPFAPIAGEITPPAKQPSNPASRLGFSALAEADRGA